MSYHMYHGKKRFDKNQLEFMAEVIISAGFDNIEAATPQGSSEAFSYDPNVWTALLEAKRREKDQKAIEDMEQRKKNEIEFLTRRLTELGVRV